MREYKLASSDNRQNVDLTEYEDLIKDVIHSEAPNITVTVFPDRYVLNNPISKGQAIRIGRRLAKSSLGQYCVLRPILFIGQESDECDEKSKGGNQDNENAKSNNTTTGGRPRAEATAS